MSELGVTFFKWIHVKLIKFGVIDSIKANLFFGSVNERPWGEFMIGEFFTIKRIFVNEDSKR